MNQDIISLLRAALLPRAPLLDQQHEAALRLFNGFYEGCPDVAIDLYGRTLLLHNYADDPEQAGPLLEAAQATLLAEFPWVTNVVVKPRRGRSDDEKQGLVVYGNLETLTKRIREHGIWYAVDLLLNRDASLYLDTRNLRLWAKEQLSGKTVLNTFAYTGSLGVAAQGGGAQRVVQLDLNRSFLNVAKTSYTLNGFPIDKANFLAGDFWTQINQLKRQDERFDCVFVDPPFFAATGKGTVDLQTNADRVINKVRPLIADGGKLVAINNALFVSGAAYLASLERLCADGYLSIEQLIPVPADFAGYPETRVSPAPVDPAPFNHPTKIAVLQVRRKPT